MPTLQIVITSTREGRQGPKIAAWFRDVAVAHGGFDVELVDLAEVNLPMFDEPGHPRLGVYTRPSSKAWSATVSRADAFVFVTPEYNFGSPPALVNALDHLAKEWAYKPVGFVSYGGVSAGLRSVQMTKLIVTALNMMPIPPGVALPAFTKWMTPDGFRPEDAVAASGHAMLTELRRWTDALAVLRSPQGGAGKP